MASRTWKWTAVLFGVLTLGLGGGPALQAPIAAAQSHVFPDVEGGYNGMKLGYSVSGAMLGAPTDWGSSLRSHDGRITGSAVTVSGWAEQRSGFGADLYVTVTVGDKEEYYQAGGATPWRQEFSVSVPVPAGVTEGSFGIMETGSYQAGERTLFVGGSFAPDKPIAAPVDGQVFTPIQTVALKRGFDADTWSARRAPAIGVPVELVRFASAPGQTGALPPARVVASTTTDDKGKYRFAAVPMTTTLAVSTTLSGPDVAVLDASGSPNPYPATPSPSSRVTIVSRTFDITGGDEKVVDIPIDALAGHLRPEAGSKVASRLNDYGLLYYHTHQAFALANSLKVQLDTHPVPIYAFLPGLLGSYWWGPAANGANAARPPHIATGADRNSSDLAATSGTDSLDRADNREWHEFGHHVMADAFDDKMPTDNVGCPSPPALDRNCAHLGYYNASTNDSWKEGFAEFYSMLVGRMVGGDASGPFLYDWIGGVTDLEANMMAWTMRNDSWGSLEEFAVAGLLWDLVDGVSADDATVLTRFVGGLPVPTIYADHVEVDLATLWPILSETSGGGYGYTYYVKELHDRLKAHGVGQSPDGPGGMTALDETFVAHGFFTDTGATPRAYDVGEEIGSSGNLTFTHGYRYTDNGQLKDDSISIGRRLVRQSPPPVPSTFVELDAVDENGRPVNVSRVHVDVRFDPPFSAYDYQYDRPLAAGRMAVLVADPQYPVRVSVSPVGSMADAPFVLTNDTLWNGVPDEHGVIADHTYVVRIQRAYMPLVVRHAYPCTGEACPRPSQRTATVTPTRTPRVTWPAPTAATTTPSPVGPTATAGQTRDDLGTAVAGTLTASAPTSPATETPDVVATAVAATLTARAPTPTLTLTPDVVATSVAGTLTAIAPGSTPTGTMEPSATPTVTSSVPTATPQRCNVVSNGGFEQGWLGWQRAGVTGLADGRLGSTYAARLVGADSASAEIHQPVSIPPTASQVIVIYWWGMVSEEDASATDRFDTLASFAVYSPDLFELLEVVSNANTRGYWMPSGYVLSGGAIGDFDVAFSARTDASATTSFVIDDVEVLACPGAPVQLPHVFVAPPSGPPGLEFAVTGTGFRPGEAVVPWVVRQDNGWRYDVPATNADDTGALSTTVYAYADTPVGTYQYAAMGLQSALPASTTFELVH